MEGHVRRPATDRQRILRFAVTLACVLAFLFAPVSALGQGRAMGRVMAEPTHGLLRDVTVSSTPPAWLAAPTKGRLVTSDGMEVQVLQNASVSFENASIGMMVGALRNVGACARNVSVRFQYTDEHWQPLGAPIQNEARVTMADPDGLIPYRFRLRHKSDFPRAPIGYLVEVMADDSARTPAGAGSDASGVTGAAQRCPPRSYGFELKTGTRSTVTSFQIVGTLQVVAGGQIRADGITLTALLLDKDDQVLEVLTGAPDLRGVPVPTGLLDPSHVVPFTLATPVPLAKWVSRVQVFAEVLADARPLQ